MVFLYNLGIFLYRIVAWLIAPINEKAKYWIKGRRGLFSKMQAEIGKNSSIAWFHAASLGEFEQGRPLIEALKKERPEFKILLTFFSPSGYEVRKNYNGADYIYYLPIDTRKNARKFLNIVNPKIAIFIKYEFWYHYLTQLKEKKVTLLLISSIFRPEQVFFKRYGVWYRKMLDCFNHIFVQDSQSVELLKSIGVSNVTQTGDTRFDRVAQIAGSAKENEMALQFSVGKFTFVFGSTWDEDEELLLRYINESAQDIRFIIAPHEIHEAHLRSLTQKLKTKTVLYSQAGQKDLTDTRVMVIDNIGMLSSLYKYGNLAYIGGGFGSGIHNILEAAVFGMPVVFGPKYHKFSEARELIASGGAFSIATFEELKAIFDGFISDGNKLKTTSDISKNFVTQNLGATQKIMDFLKHYKFGMQNINLLR
jgi:3-deoxy-D-manno-octulosonic-acid transferase